MSASRRPLRLLLLVLGAAGCAPERLLRVESQPPGALVRLDDLVIGRTPLEHHFEHYGARRLTLSLTGYTPWSERVELDAPWHATFPIDLITEVLIPLGLRDVHEVSAVLEPYEEVSEVPDIEPLIERAEAVRAAVDERLEKARTVRQGEPPEDAH